MVRPRSTRRAARPFGRRAWAQMSRNGIAGVRSRSASASSARDERGCVGSRGVDGASATALQPPPHLLTTLPARAGRPARPPQRPTAGPASVAPPVAMSTVMGHEGVIVAGVRGCSVCSRRGARAAATVVAAVGGLHPDAVCTRRAAVHLRDRPPAGGRGAVLDDTAPRPRAVVAGLLRWFRGGRRVGPHVSSLEGSRRRGQPDTPRNQP